MVSMLFNETSRTVTVSFIVVNGPNVKEVSQWLSITHPKVTAHVFVEKYVPRQRLGTDERMVKAEAAFTAGLPAAVLVRNTGAKQIIRPSLMEMLGVWQFGTPTHHQDLRSAARIGLYGMVKEPPLNAWLSDVVKDTLDGKPWGVR